MSNPVIITLLIACVVLSAFFSGTEMVFAKVNKTKLTRDAENNVKSAILANSFAQDYNDTITIILIGNNLVNIAASSMATILFTSLNPVNGEMYATLIMTSVILVFGEIIPKSIATSYANGLSRVLAYPMRFFQIIFWPITWVIKKAMNGLNKLLSKKSTEDEIDEDEADLFSLIDSMYEEKGE